MTDKELELKKEFDSDNELIAEFIGFEIISENPVYKGMVLHGRTWKAPFDVRPYFGGYIAEQLYKFSCDWEWIMPVVKAIRKLRVPKKMIYELMMALINVDSETAHKIIVKIIKWHKSEQK